MFAMVLCQLPKPITDTAESISKVLSGHSERSSKGTGLAFTDQGKAGRGRALFLHGCYIVFKIPSLIHTCIAEELFVFNPFCLQGLLSLEEAKTMLPANFVKTENGSEFFKDKNVEGMSALPSISQTQVYAKHV